MMKIIKMKTGSVFDVPRDGKIIFYGHGTSTNLSHGANGGIKLNAGAFKNFKYKILVFDGRGGIGSEGYSSVYHDYCSIYMSHGKSISYYENY